MFTSKELLDELKEMKKESGIKDGRVTLFYGDIDCLPSISDARAEIEKDFGHRMETSAVGNSRFGRFLSIDGRTKGDRKLTIYCSEAFYEKIK